MTEKEIKVNNLSDVSGMMRERKDSEESPSSPEIEFKPIIELPVVETKTLEEEEEELIKMRARLYRFETEEEPSEWKERGTGEIKILKHKKTNIVRLLMRRDKTLKICANHYIRKDMELKKHANSDKAYVWSTLSDFADETPKAETLCIRFGNPENASKFQSAFEEAKELAQGLDDSGDLTDKLEKVTLGQKESEDETESEGEDEDEDEEGKESSHETTQEKENERPEADQYLELVKSMKQSADK